MAAARKEAGATDPTRAFFDGLAQRGHEPLLQSLSGTLRFDLHGGRRVEHWYVTIEKGDVTVTRDAGDADAVVRTEKALFDGMATGRVNAMAAMLRGVVHAEGDLGLVAAFQRLFPGPPGSRRRKR